MKRFAVAAVAVVLTAGVAGCSAHISNVENRAVPFAAKGVSEQDMQRNIIAAGTRRGWKIEPAGPGKLRGALNKGAVQDAVVDIEYTAHAYSIRLVRAAGTDTNVEKYWNRWMRNLALDIDQTLEASALARK